MAKYLQYFPKPLLDDLINGRWLPVVGAGMSLNAALPKGQTMPLWAALGKAFEADLSDFSATGPVDAISAYEHEYGRARLIDRLSELLHIRDAQPGEAHRAFSSIKFDLVCTTNFDFLLEKQYSLVPRYVNPIVEEEQLSLNGIRDGTVLLKLHGDLRHPSRLIVTEADYDGFLNRYPLLSTYLANLLITKTAVLIGYSLDDPDFRQVWAVVTQRLGKTRRQAYAIAVGAQPADVARFARRGVTVINLPKGKLKYGEVLAAAFDELSDYWRNHILDVSTITEEAPLVELKLPKNTSSRLVFFSVPLRRLPIYRALIFSAVSSLGLVPVTADDVVSPGDSVSAKIDALMDRAVAIVIEVSSYWASAELRLAISRASKSSDGMTPRIILIDTLEGYVPTIDIESVHLRYIKSAPESDAGLSELIQTLEQLVPSEATREAEAVRLLNAGEYRAAVISAMSLLEDTLRRRLDKPVWSDARRPMSMRQLLDLSFPNRTFPNSARVDEWIQLRNKAVHQNAQVSHTEANEVVKGVLKLLE